MAPMDSKPSQMVSYRSKTTPTLNIWRNIGLIDHLTDTRQKVKNPHLGHLGPKGPKWPKIQICQMAVMDSTPSQMVLKRSKTTPTLTFGSRTRQTCRFEVEYLTELSDPPP